MKYAVINEDGTPSGFYAPEIHGEAIPADAVEISEEQWLEFTRNSGRRRWSGHEVVPYEPPPVVPSLDDYRRAIQAHVDATAQARGYDGGASCASYAGSTFPAWAAEATAFVSWRDAVWAHAHAELEKVQNGTRHQPDIAAIIAELPPMAWPSA